MDGALPIDQRAEAVEILRYHDSTIDPFSRGFAKVTPPTNEQRTHFMADGSPHSMQTYRWDDPFDLDGRLTDDERMIRDAARSYARDRLLPRVVEAFAMRCSTEPS
jgi:hypothetical protein